MMAEMEETEYQSEAENVGPVLDEEEFRCAFGVFSEGNDGMATTNSVLIPFLKSLGITKDLVAHIKDSSDRGFIQERELLGILKKFFPSLKESWPSHGDVLRAFQVFDTEGVGFIKVTMLKRFLVQAQLNVDEVVLERLIRDNCQIDGDDLINYSDFVQSIRQQHK